MDSTIGYIRGKPTDFKICKECKAINWYENEYCHQCFKTDFEEDYSLVEKHIKRYIDDRIKNDDHLCSDCMVSV